MRAITISLPDSLKTPLCYFCGKKAAGRIHIICTVGFLRPEVSVEYCKRHEKKADKEAKERYFKAALRIKFFERLVVQAILLGVGLVLFLLLLFRFPVLFLVYIGLAIASAFWRAFRMKHLKTWKERNFVNKTLIVLFTIFFAIDLFTGKPAFSLAMDVGLLAYWIFI